MKGMAVRVAPMKPFAALSFPINLERVYQTFFTCLYVIYVYFKRSLQICINWTHNVDYVPVHSYAYFIPDIDRISIKFGNSGLNHTKLLSKFRFCSRR
jgi:hypothetical protein